MHPDASGILTEADIARRIQEWNAREQTLSGNTVLAGFRMAAVLVPMLWSEEQWHLLFTRRAETVHSHKGQVSFPGGAAEPEDAALEDTALREAFEEIGLKQDEVRIFGRLNSRPTVSSYLVTPVVGRIRWPNEFNLSTAEVSRLFTIPLAWLADPSNREERLRSFTSSYSEKVIYYQPYHGEILWGASARITMDLLHALGLDNGKAANE